MKISQPEEGMIEIHLCYEKQLFNNTQCIRVFGSQSNGKDLDIFKGFTIIHIGMDHLIFNKDQLFKIISKLMKEKIPFEITGS